MNKADILKSRNPVFLGSLEDKIFHALRDRKPLDQRTLTEAIQHFGLILEVGDEHYLSFGNQDMAQAVLTTLQHQHPNYLAAFKRGPLFNRRDNSYRINITNDYFDSLAHADNTDFRTVLRIKTPEESKAIIKSCLKRLEWDRDVDLYENRQELIEDMLKHGLFSVVDNTRAAVYIADDQSAKKIYVGLWMYAPELLHEKNYGNGFVKFGNAISREGASRSLTEIQLSLEPAQALLTKHPIENQKIINSGNSVGGDKPSLSEALANHLDLLKSNNELLSNNDALANFIKPILQRKEANASSKRTIHPDEVHQYIHVPTPDSVVTIDATHLFAPGRKLSPALAIQSEEVDNLFQSLPSKPEQTAAATATISAASTGNSTTVSPFKYSSPTDSEWKAFTERYREYAADQALLKLRTKEKDDNLQLAPDHLKKISAEVDKATSLFHELAFSNISLADFIKIHAPNGFVAIEHRARPNLAEVQKAFDNARSDLSWGQYLEKYYPNLKDISSSDQRKPYETSLDLTTLIHLMNNIGEYLGEESRDLKKRPLHHAASERLEAKLVAHLKAHDLYQPHLREVTKNPGHAPEIESLNAPITAHNRVIRSEQQHFLNRPDSRVLAETLWSMNLPLTRSYIGKNSSYAKHNQFSLVDREDIEQLVYPLWLRAITTFDINMDTLLSTHYRPYLDKCLQNEIEHEAVGSRDNSKKFRFQKGLMRNRLDAPVKNSDLDGHTMGDFVPAKSVNPFALAAMHEQRDKIEMVLLRLPKRERMVLKLTFGLYRNAEERKIDGLGDEVKDGGSYTLEEMSTFIPRIDSFGREDGKGITRERVRQIRKSAIKRFESQYGILFGKKLAQDIAIAMNELCSELGNKEILPDELPPQNKPVPLEQPPSNDIPVAQTSTPLLAGAAATIIPMVTNELAPPNNVPPAIIVLPSDDDRISKHPKPKRSGLHTVASKPAHTEIKPSSHYADYLAYIHSFGFLLKERREERNLSRDEVAENASRMLTAGEKINANHIKLWEQARGELPTDHQFEALAKILIDDNDKIIDKLQQRDEFRIAYIKSLAARKHPSESPEDELYLFADKLSELRETLTVGNISLTRDKLAVMIENKLKSPVDQGELELLHQHKGNFIAGIEAGVIKPSKNLMLMLVKALGEENQLNEEQKRELYEAYERIPGEPIEMTRKKPSNRANKSVAVSL